MGRKFTPIILSVLLILSLYTTTNAYDMKQELNSQIDSHLIVNESDDSNRFNVTFDLPSNHTYKIVVYLYENSVTSARVNGSVQISIDDTVVIDRGLHDYSESADEGGTSAKAEVTHRIDPEYNISVQVSGHFYEGDYWSVQVYRDLPFELEHRSSYFNGLFFVGLLLTIAIVAAWLVFFSVVLTDLRNRSDDELEKQSDEIYSE